MPPPDPAAEERLLRLADAIADRAEIDWDEVEAAAPDDSVAKLRTLDRLARAFGEASGEQQDGSGVAPLFLWGSLQVLDKLGEGSFGEVFRAYDPALDREVALKLRRSDRFGVDGGSQRFVREAQKLARLRHPNVVAVYGADAHEGKLGFWTDLVDGKTLSAVVVDQGPMGAEEAASVGLSVCRALAAVHGAGLVHGDVKPSNVMREHGGRIVLMDFGAASMSKETSAWGGELELQGTPATLAPELLDGKGSTPVSDLYSLGALLYHLVSGAYPVQGFESLEELRRLHRDGGRVPLRDRRADLPAAFVEVVDRALALDPEDRYQSAGAMETALLRAMGDAALVAAPTRRHVRRWHVAAVTVAVLLGYGLWSLLTGSMDASESLPASVSLQEVQALASGAGNQGAASFSPDGRMIAYLDDVGGVPQVWVRSVAGGQPLQVTDGGAAASRPRWSRRDEIVFSRAGAIWAVPALGGEARQVVAEGVNPDVSADGSLVVYERDRWLWTAPTDGGTPQRLENVPRRSFVEAWASPALSPDASRVAYFMQEAGPVGDLWVAPLDGGTPRRLTFDRVEAGAPAWTPDGGGLVFWSRRQGTLNLWLLRLETGAIRPLTAGVGEDSAPAVAPDGSRLAFTNTENHWVLTAQDLETGQERELLDRRLPIWTPEVSPDGRRIAFFQATGPNIHLFTLDLATLGVRQVTAGDGPWNIHPRWSWSGEHLYYYQERPSAEFRRVPATGGESELVAPGWDWLTHMQAVPSPDETRIAYVDDGPSSGATIIWNRTTDERSTLPDPHFHAPQWSPDGTTLIGFTHAGAVQRCTVDPIICDRVTEGYRPRFSADGQTIYFHRGLDGGRWELWAIGVDGGDAQRLGVTGPHGPLDPTFALAADGEAIYTRHQPGESDLWIARLESGG